MRYFALMVLLLLAACGSGDNAEAPRETRTTLQRACTWLWSQQADDGGWHSETYGLMRSGQSLTPFVLHALLTVPEESCKRPGGGVDRALEFIRDHTNSDGCLGRADPDIADYPNHATSYAVRCLLRAGNESDRKLVARMCAYLAGQQFGPARGIEPSSPRWGGWGFGSRGRPGIMDVGHTRHALQALHEADKLDAHAAARAQDFLRLIQRHPDGKRPQPPVPGEPESDALDTYDGGFYFSPADVGMNKGRHEPAKDGKAAWWRSYATATCDGLLSLLAAGVDPSDERVTAAAKWLADHPELERPAGIPTNDPTPWYDAVHYYHLAVRAEAWSAIKHDGDWRKQIEEHLAKAQREDGSFVNDKSPMMKEDDPILCTALAVVALTN